MTNRDYNKDLKDIDDYLDLLNLFQILFVNKFIIISITSFVSIIGVIFSLLLPNIYESKALLSPADPLNSISRSLQGYAGLAGLAGVSLPKQDFYSNSAQAIAKLNSLSFFEKEILPNIFLPDLMALNSWDSNENTLIYDESIYNENTDSWVSKDSMSKNEIPSPQKSFKVYMANHFKLEEDIKTGFINLSIKHQSPYVAKEWAELTIYQMNNFFRDKDKQESEKAINYLNLQLSITSLSEVKEAILDLLKEETQKLSLIEAKEYYVFEYIDPPAIMETKAEPKRAIICILSAFFGFVLSAFIVLVRHFIYKE